MVFDDWKKKFGSVMGRKVVIMKGENGNELKLMDKGKVIICKDEKWDVM
jgi:hypothetical protein